MTKKDFQLIADVIKNLPTGERGMVAVCFSEALQKTNPRFDVERFLAACVPPDTERGL